MDTGLRKMKGVQDDQRKPDGVIYVYGWIRPGCGKWVEDNQENYFRNYKDV